MKIFFIIVQFLIIIHVNSFILLSGFFQSNSHFKLSKLFNLLIQVVFYSELFLIIGNKMRIVVNYSIVLLINNFIKKLSYNDFKYFLILLFIIFSIIPYFSGQRITYNNGCNFYHFIFLYLIGAFLNNYPLKDHMYLKS